MVSSNILDVIKFKAFQSRADPKRIYTTSERYNSMITTIGMDTQRNQNEECQISALFRRVCELEQSLQIVLETAIILYLLHTCTTRRHRRTHT